MRRLMNAMASGTLAMAAVFLLVTALGAMLVMMIGFLQLLNVPHTDALVLAVLGACWLAMVALFYVRVR